MKRNSNVLGKKEMKRNSNVSGKWVNIIFDRVCRILSCIWDTMALPFTGCCASSFIILSASGYSDITEALLATIKRWHGSIDEQFSCIDNVVNVILKNASGIRPPEFQDLVNYRDRLQTLINHCHTTSASAADRQERNSVLKAAVGLCLLEIRVWAYSMYTQKMLTADDVHTLGFLLPGEHGGHHSKSEPTDAIPEVKVSVLNEDFIRVVVDQSAGENAGPVKHGWPVGVRHVMIVIIAVDGMTEIYRLTSTHLHNDIEMPAGSHGKQFIVKAAFLRHVDDKPKFGNEPTFSMPLTTEDLAAALNKQQQENSEKQQ
jgi:hypothetical protein